MALVDDKFAVAWHSQDAERPEANRKLKKLKPSVPDKKDAETPESNTRRFFDLMKEFKKLKHSKKAMNSQPDVLDEVAICNLKKQFVEAKHSEKDMKPHPDILKKVAERLEENSHPDILKKGAAGVEARSRCIDDWKKKLEKTKKATNSHPVILKKADILQKEVENMEARFQFLDFLQEQSEKLKTSVKVPISTEREESDDEIEYSVAPPLRSPRHDLIIEYTKSRQEEVENMEARFRFLDFLQEQLKTSVKVPISTEREEDEAERKRSKDEIKKGAKEIVERFEYFGSVFGGYEIWDDARRVSSRLMTAQ